jgi:hypothetical protein
MKGWTHGEAINGNDVWFQGGSSGDWFWSGGFTSQSTANLPEVIIDPPDPEPEPEDYVVPRELGDQIRDLVNQAFPATPTVTSEETEPTPLFNRLRRD